MSVGHNEAEMRGENEIRGDAHDFDEHRVSDEDNDEHIYPLFNPKTTFHPDFFISQIFATKKEFMLATQSDAIKQRRNIHFSKKKMIIEGYMLSVVNLSHTHTCAPLSKVKSLTSGWLSQKFIQRFPSVFMEDASYDTRCEVSGQQAHRAKSLALIRIDGDQDAKLGHIVMRLGKQTLGHLFL
ncbi:hypothetical protein ACS0TY_024211 [Phlomoides rotata]